MKRIKAKENDLYCIVNKNGCCSLKCPFTSIDNEYCILNEFVTSKYDGTKKYNKKYKQYERTETCKKFFENKED